MCRQHACPGFVQRRTIIGVYGKQRLTGFYIIADIVMNDKPDRMIDRVAFFGAAGA